MPVLISRIPRCARRNGIAAAAVRGPILRRTASLDPLNDHVGIERPCAQDLISEEDEGQGAATRELIEGGVSLRPLQVQELDHAEANLPIQTLFNLCPQDLEAPLQRHLSSRALNDLAEGGLKRVAAVRAAASSTSRFGDYLKHNLTHGCSPSLRHASQTRYAAAPMSPTPPSFVSSGVMLDTLRMMTSEPEATPSSRSGTPFPRP